MYQARDVAPRRRFGRLSLLLVLAMIVSVFAVAPTAGADSWEEKVNGNATYAAIPGLRVAVSAWTNDDGGFGNTEYEYYSSSGTLLKKFHFQATEVCFHDMGGNSAMKMYGEWKMQEGTPPYVQPIAGVGIIDYVDGTDTLRVPLFYTVEEASAWCHSTSGWGGPIGSGDYRVRSK